MKGKKNGFLLAGLLVNQKGFGKGAALLPALLCLLFLPVLTRASEPWTLERAIQHALTNSPDARLAVQRIVAAQAGLEQANAAFMPKLQFNASYLRTDNPMLVFGAALNQRKFDLGMTFNDVPDTDNLNLNGTLTVPVYAGGRIRAGRKAARADSEATRQMADAVRNSLAFEVARVFYSVQKTRGFTRASEAAVQGFEANLAIANHRFDAGTALRQDVLDVEVRLAQAREDLVRARNANALARRALRNLLGIEEPSIEVSATAPTVTEPGADEPSRRPELLAVSWRAQAAEARVREAQSSYLPRVSAFGRYAYDEGWTFDGHGDSYTAGVHLQWDLWDGDLTRARVKEARAALDTAREEERRLRLALDLEVEQARLNLKESIERLAVSARSVDQAAESVQLTRARFEQGLALATQVIDAETALTAARVRRAEAESDRQIATAALRKALGLPLLPSDPPQP
jgi:outer membrane protein